MNEDVAMIQGAFGKPLEGLTGAYAQEQENKRPASAMEKWIVGHLDSGLTPQEIAYAVKGGVIPPPPTGGAPAAQPPAPGGTAPVTMSPTQLADATGLPQIVAHGNVPVGPARVPSAGGMAGAGAPSAAPPPMPQPPQGGGMSGVPDGPPIQTGKDYRAFMEAYAAHGKAKRSTQDQMLLDAQNNELKRLIAAGNNKTTTDVAAGNNKTSVEVANTNQAGANTRSTEHETGEDRRLGVTEGGKNDRQKLELRNRLDVAKEHVQAILGRIREGKESEADLKRAKLEQDVMGSLQTEVARLIQSQAQALNPSEKVDAQIDDLNRQISEQKLNLDDAVEVAGARKKQKNQGDHGDMAPLANRTPARPRIEASQLPRGQTIAVDKQGNRFIVDTTTRRVIGPAR